jgi:hypothetical protein
MKAEMIALTAFLKQKTTFSLHADLVMTMRGAELMSVGQKSSRLRIQSVQLCIEVHNCSGVSPAWFHFALVHPAVSAVYMITISCAHIQ